MGVGKENNGDFIGGPTDLPKIVQEERGCCHDPCIDQTDFFTQQDIRVDKALCVLVLAKGEPEMVFKGMNGFCNFHQSCPK
jgi:hypothetical protein